MSYIDTIGVKIGKMYQSKNNTDMTNPKSVLDASSLLCFSYFLRINCSPEKKECREQKSYWKINGYSWKLLALDAVHSLFNASRT